MLLVDDEPSILRGLAGLLRGRGYVVLTAQSGDVAFQIMTREHVDVAVIDRRIPGWRGDVLHAAVAAYQPHLSRRTVFISGDIGDGVRQVSEQAGCPPLMKPFDIEELEWHLIRLLHEATEQPRSRGADGRQFGAAGNAGR